MLIQFVSSQMQIAGVGGRRFKNEDAFIIRHFAADVCYQTKGWLAKNNDGIHSDLMNILKVSEQIFILIYFIFCANILNFWNNF